MSNQETIRAVKVGDKTMQLVRLVDDIGPHYVVQSKHKSGEIRLYMESVSLSNAENHFFYWCGYWDGVEG